MSEVERITKLELGGRLSFHAEFADGQEVYANLAGLCARSRHFRIFLDQPELFEFFHLVHNGIGIEWDNGLDYSAGALLRLGRAQEDMTGSQFKAWQKILGLSNSEAADLLGVSLATVKNYHRRNLVPTAVKLACDSFEADANLVAARFVPRNRRLALQKNA